MSKRFILAMLLAPLVAVPVLAHPSHVALASFHHHRPGCSKLFTVAEGKRAADVIYRGTRTVTKANLHLLGRIEHCQRNPRAGKFMRWYDHHQAQLNAQRVYNAQFTGYEVDGYTSTFGPPNEGDSGTADGGSMGRPCIALRDTSTLGHMFLVTVPGHGHSAKLLHCDSGPYGSGREIDITGAGLEAMGIDPYGYDNYWGTAKELK